MSLRPSARCAGKHCPAMSDFVKVIKGGKADEENRILVICKDSIMMVPASWFLGAFVN